MKLTKTSSDSRSSRLRGAFRFARTSTALALIFCASRLASAANQTWTAGGSDGLWGDATNWSLTVPAAADTAMFLTSGTSISLSGSANSVKSIAFDTSTGSYTFNTGGVGGQFNLTASGSIALQPTATGTGLVETFNAPIFFAGAYAFSNNLPDPTSDLVFNGNISNTATSTLTLSGSGKGSNLISGNITDGVGVQTVSDVATSGTWTLSGSNNYGGTTTLNGASTLVLTGVNSGTGQTSATGFGTLILNSSSNGGLASGLLTLNACTLTVDVANLSLSNNVSLGGNTENIIDASNLTFNGNWTQTASSTVNNEVTSGTLAILGNIYLSNTSTAGRTLTIGGPGATVLSGTIANFNGVGGTAGSLIFNPMSDSTVLELLGANTYSGTTTFQKGILILGTSSVVSGGNLVSGPLGSGTLSILSNSAYQLEDNGSNIVIANSVLFGAASAKFSLTFRSTGSGSITFDGTSLTTPAQFVLSSTSTTFNVFNTVTINDAITGSPGAFAKAGTGLLVLGGSNSFVSGTTSVTAGIMRLQNNSALGQTGLLTVSSGATVQLQGGISTAQAVTANLTGVGVNSNGAFENVSGSNTYTGLVNLTGASTIGSDAGTLNLTGGVTEGVRLLTFVGAGNTIVSGTGISGSGGVTVNGSNGGTVVLSASNSYTGTTAVTGGTLIVTGSLAGTTAATVTNGTLEIDGMMNSAATLTGTTGGILQGTGSLGAITMLSTAKLAPGLSTGGTAAGTLTSSGAVTMSGSGTFSIRLGVTTAGGLDNDQLADTGSNTSVTLNGVTLSLTAGSAYTTAAASGLTFIIVNGGYTAGTGGTFASGSTVTMAGTGDVYNVLYGYDPSTQTVDASGHDVALQLEAIPEPATWGMILSGFGMLFGIQRLRRRRVGT